MIRRTILFDNQCGFALGENSRAPNPFVTWRFNEQDGQRNYFWGLSIYNASATVNKKSDSKRERQ